MPVGALAVAMVQASFFTSLMPAVGAAPLILAGLAAALRAAIPMAAVAMRADIENRVTVQTAARPLPEVRVVMSHRRHRYERGWTTTVWLCQLRTSLFGLTSQGFAAESGTLPRQRQGSCLPRLQITITDGKMMGACGAMMLCPPAERSENFVFR